MAKRVNKHLRAPRPLNTARYPRRVLRQGASYLVRSVPADSALKVYTCPGCQNSIRPGTAHVVAWPEEPGFGFTSGLDERRHWHSYCWDRA